MAQKLFEKVVKNELGKPRSITKSTIKPYEQNDEEKTEEIIEEKKITTKQEKTLFEKVVDIFATSPYFHLYSVPLPKNQKPVFMMSTSKEDLLDELKASKGEILQQYKEKFPDFDEDTDYDSISFYTQTKKMKQLSESDIRNNKSVMKYIGSKSEQALQNVIDMHEKIKYNEEHKVEIVKANIQKVWETKDIHFYIIEMLGFKEDLAILVMAQNEKQAAKITVSNRFMTDFLKEHCDNIKSEDGLNVKVCCVTEEEELNIIYEELDYFLERKNISVEALTSPSFTVEEYRHFLKSMDKIDELTPAETKNAIEQIVMNNNFTHRREINDIMSHMSHIKTVVEEG